MNSSIKKHKLCPPRPVLSFRASSLAMGGEPKAVASVAQPASFLPLRELTERSARIAQLKLCIYHPWQDSYTYTWAGEARQGEIFKCLLVDPTDPRCYCHAEYRKTGKNEKSYTAASKKFKEGSVFIFKKIAFVNNSKSAFLSAPKRDVVDLQCFCAEAVHGLQQASVVQPCPTGMIREKTPCSPRAALRYHSADQEHICNPTGRSRTYMLRCSIHRRQHQRSNGREHDVDEGHAFPS